MKTFLWILFTKYSRFLTIATVAVYAVVAVLGIYLGVQLFLLNPTTALLEKNLKSQRQDLAMAERNNKDLKASPPVKTAIVAGHQIVDQLQRRIEALAATSECRVDQFTAPEERGPYTPHYNTDPGGYGAFHVRMTVSGNLGNIFSMLQTLSDGPIPFEFTSLGFTPAGTSGDSSSATVEIDVLSKPEAT